MTPKVLPGPADCAKRLELLKQYLEKKRHQVHDHGAHQFDPLDDYPDYIIPCAKAVSLDSKSKANILGGSGHGDAIASNRIK